MSAKEYQLEVVPLIRNKIRNDEVHSEWRAFRNRNLQYSPRVDIAVGPFSIIRGENQIDNYNRLLSRGRTRTLINRLYRDHNNNLEALGFENLVRNNINQVIQRNINARCLLAIEIENSSTRKHIMGSIVNAASLGRVGIGIAYKAEVLKTFTKILNYLSFLESVGKNTYNTSNFIIVTKEQFKNRVE